MPPGCQPMPGAATLTLADVLRCGLAVHDSIASPSGHHWKVLNALMACRTPALGGHQYLCRHCGKEHFVPHSCRNRHCPRCQGVNSHDWLDRQAQLLLPIPYFHLVFTLPHDLNALIRQNRRQVYDLLFAAASTTLLQFGRKQLQAQIGVTAVLHTWSQTLVDHYHLHCIVTGGGLRTDNLTWRATSRHWLFPVRALSRVFRARFREGLQALHAERRLEYHGQLQPLADRRTFQRLLRSACAKNWVVYSKRPFAGPDTVLAYLSRYTHRVGITNRRILALDPAARNVTFAYKDYGDQSRKKTMTLALPEFIRRFCLHILPERFVKIRHYGLLANRGRQVRLARVRAALKATPQPAVRRIATTNSSPLPLCPFCRQPGLVLVRITPPVKISRRLDSS